MTSLTVSSNRPHLRKEFFRKPSPSKLALEQPKIGSDREKPLTQVREIYKMASELLKLPNPKPSDCDLLKQVSLKSFNLLKIHVGFDSKVYESQTPQNYLQAVKAASLKTQLLLEAQQDLEWIEELSFPFEEKTLQKLNALFNKIYQNFELPETPHEKVKKQVSLLCKYLRDWIDFLRLGEAGFKALR